MKTVGEFLQMLPEPPQENIIEAQLTALEDMGFGIRGIYLNWINPEHLDIFRKAIDFIGILRTP